MSKKAKKEKINIGEKIITYLALAAAFFLLSRGENLLGALSFGLFVGCIYLKQRLVPFLLFVATSCLNNLTHGLIAASQGAVMILLTAISYKFKKRIGKFWLFFYILLAHGYYFFKLVPTEGAGATLGCFLVGAAFGYVCVFAFRSVFVRGLRYKAGADESICIFVFCMALARGVGYFVLNGVELNLFLAALAVPLALLVGGAGGAFMTATCIGAGSALTNGSLVPLALFVSWAAVATAFKINRYLSAAAVILCQVAVVYFFNLYRNAAVTALLMTFAGCACCCMIPNRAIKKLRQYLGQDDDAYSPRQIVNRMRVNFSRRLFDLSEVFFAMQRTFNSLTRGVMPPEKAVYAITQEVVTNVCNDCPNRNKCWRENATVSQNRFEKLISCGLDRGRVNLLDLPPDLAASCNRSSSILSIANGEVMSYKQYYLVNSSFDGSRELLASVSDGIGRVMLKMSEDSRATVGFDKEKEKALIEQLTYYNVLVKEAIIYCEKENFSVALVVARSDIDKPQISDIVSKVCATPLVCCAREKLPQEEWCMLYFSPRPRFDLSVGLSRATKNGSELSGDTYTFLRLPQDKYLVALCDGMGSGERAEKASATAIGMVENFYRAGFDNDLILDCVNRLLTAAESEVFTAVDICVVDLKDGLADFVKLGAPMGMIKVGDAVNFIEGASLPVGIVEEVKPTITKKVLRKDDMIVLASDGFWDSFDDKTVPATILHDSFITNPQALAENLLEQALSATDGVAVDDITVLVAKVF